MKAAILTIGDEILLGQITDTNSASIARTLASSGIRIATMLSVADSATAIVQALESLFAGHDLVLATGGLGPTKDDLTKKVLADYFDDSLVFHDQTFRQIEKLLALRGVPMNPLNRNQALLPSKARILPNRKGTAAGMWFEREGKILIALPGVPFEMEHLMQEQVLPLLKERFPGTALSYRLLQVSNTAESVLAEKLDDFEKSLPDGLRLAYLPSPGIVKLRLTANQQAQERLDPFFEQLCLLLRAFSFRFAVISAPEENLKTEEKIGLLLGNGSLSLSTAESCTGGEIARLLVSVAGSSRYFKGGIVAYSNAVKEKILGVDSPILARYGAVSEPVVRAMALSARQLFQSDYALATSGIAGPGGGSEEKPVGTVWIGLASPSGCQARCFHFASDRQRNIAQAASAALEWLWTELLEQSPSSPQNP